MVGGGFDDFGVAVEATANCSGVSFGFPLMEFHVSLLKMHYFQK